MVTSSEAVPQCLGAMISSRWTVANPLELLCGMALYVNDGRILLLMVFLSGIEREGGVDAGLARRDCWLGGRGVDAHCRVGG
jgi:hypothetical protein